MSAPEPANLTGLVDAGGDTWVRVDEPRKPHQWGSWWPLTDGPHWEPRARNGVGQPRSWSAVEEYGPFLAADPVRTARALARVREELSW